MSRTEFLRSLGATCKNDMWSWSFIDETNKRIIFEHGRILDQQMQLKL